MATRPAPIIAAVLLLLPVLYVGSYLALVTPAGTTVHPNDPKLYQVTYYRVGGSWASVGFWPLEQLDRRMRPRSWMIHWGRPHIIDLRNAEDSEDFDVERFLDILSEPPGPD
jgi:hypothetical protein